MIFNALGIFLLRQFYISLPADVEEVALIVFFQRHITESITSSGFK